MSLAFIGSLIFTKDCFLGFYVVLTTLAVLTHLAFFIIVVMGWPLGPIEIVGLIIFVGYSVTLSLHIAHQFGKSIYLDNQLERNKGRMSTLDDEGRISMLDQEAQ